MQMAAIVARGQATAAVRAPLTTPVVLTRSKPGSGGAKVLPAKSPKNTAAAHITAAALHRRPSAAIPAATPGKSPLIKLKAGKPGPVSALRAGQSAGAMLVPMRMRNSSAESYRFTAATVASPAFNLSEPFVPPSIDALLDAARKRPPGGQVASLAGAEPADLQALQTALAVAVEKQLVAVQAAALKDQALALQRRWEAACAAEQQLLGGAGPLAPAGSGVGSPPSQAAAPSALGKRSLEADAAASAAEPMRKRIHAGSMMPPVVGSSAAAAALSRGMQALALLHSQQDGSIGSESLPASGSESTAAALVFGALLQRRPAPPPLVGAAACARPLPGGDGDLADCAYSSILPCLGSAAPDGVAATAASARGVDPEWPVCLFELRGACMNARCSAQHWSDSATVGVAPAQRMTSEQRRAAVDAVRTPVYAPGSVHPQDGCSSVGLLGLGQVGTSAPRDILRAPTTTFGIKAYDHVACKAEAGACRAAAAPAKERGSGRYFSAAASLLPREASATEGEQPAALLRELNPTPANVAACSHPAAAEALASCLQQQPRDEGLVVAAAALAVRTAASPEEARVCVGNALQSLPGVYELWLLAVALQPDVEAQAAALIRYVMQLASLPVFAACSRQ